MCIFTVADYAKALKGAGPKHTDYILRRAREDPGIRFHDYVRLEDIAEMTQKGGRAHERNIYPERGYKGAMV